LIALMIDVRILSNTDLGQKRPCLPPCPDERSLTGERAGQREM
jgi:hypothetical protein